MPCYRPLRVATDDDGRLDWSNYAPDNVADQPVMVPCGKCFGCRQALARDWWIRIFHEGLDHTELYRDPGTGVSTRIPDNCMVTLTYDEAHLPDGGLLVRHHLTGFLRRAGHRWHGKPRHFAVGEYGGQTMRPHFHVILFGHSFSKERYRRRTSDGQELVCSHLLDELWPNGLASIDDLNAGTARYVAGYVASKGHDDNNLTGPLAHRVNAESGEIQVYAVAPEFRTMSRAPGLGLRWIQEHYERVYERDCVTIEGRDLPPPAAYDRWLRKHHASLHSDVQARRLDKRRDSQLEWSPERVAAAEYKNNQTRREDRL